MGAILNAERLLIVPANVEGDWIISLRLPSSLPPFFVRGAMKPSDSEEGGCMDKLVSIRRSDGKVEVRLKDTVDADEYERILSHGYEVRRERRVVGGYNRRFGEVPHGEYQSGGWRDWGLETRFNDNGCQVGVDTTVVNQILAELFKQQAG